MRRITPQQTVPLRHAVLWPNKPVEYVLLPEDSTGYHYEAFDDSTTGEPLAVISLFLEDIPPEGDPDAHRGADSPTPAMARFRKFACEPSFQGRGIGTTLLRYVLDVTRDELNCRVLWCDARVESAGWYERRGLSKFGRTFYKGEVEYIRMRVQV